MRDIPPIAILGMAIWLLHSAGCFGWLAGLPGRVGWMWSLLPWGRK